MTFTRTVDMHSATQIAAALVECEAPFETAPRPYSFVAFTVRDEHKDLLCELAERRFDLVFTLVGRYTNDDKTWVDYCSARDAMEVCSKAPEDVEVLAVFQGELSLAYAPT